MTKLISLILPTRHRPELVKRLFNSIIKSSSQPNFIEVILYVDEDDINSHQLDSTELKIIRIIGPSRSMGSYNHLCLEKSKGDIIILINDDMVMQTPGWDEKIRAMDASIPDQIYLAYPNDLFKKARCSFPVLSRKTCDLLVEPYPLMYKGAFIDTHLFDLFKRLQHAGHDRIRYMEDVVFEHLHYRTGKSEYDDTYKKRDRFADDWTFIALAKKRQSDSEKLQCAILGKSFQQHDSVADIEPKKSSLFKTIAYLTGQLLFDRGLPLPWRTFLWYWFIGRYLAVRGFLWPFVGR